MPRPTRPRDFVPVNYSRPDGGWLKSIRLGQGLSLRAVAERLEVSPQAVHQFESSEVAGTISLRQLENVARAMGHRVVYALRPRETRAKNNSYAPETAVAPVNTAAAKVDEIVAPPSPPTVEHSMFLENQAADRYD